MAAPSKILLYEDIPKMANWYNEEYLNENLEYFELEEYRIPLPVKPPQYKMKNYNLPKDEQVFWRIEVPSDIHLWSESHREHFVNYMWHLRLNGEWWLIGEKEVYINGYFWFFLNFWYLEIGTYADYREEGLQYFEFWRLILNSPTIFGGTITKGRRLGDTEKSLCVPYDFCTRYKDMWSGMQNMTEPDAKDDFDRIVEAHKRMPFFFKPKHRGNATPQKVLDFRYDSESGEEFVDVHSEQLKSRIDFRASTFKAYDGKRLGFYRMGEWGKITSFDITEQWEVIKRCLSLENGELIVGKSMNESTVEEMSAESLDVAQQFWEDANPTRLLPNGQTMSGLIRLFRPATLSAPVNKFGVHAKEEMRQSIIDKKTQLIADKGYKALSDFMRKNPLDISDVFTPSADDCDLLPEILDVRKVQLQDNKDEFGNFFSQKKATRFNLYWEGGEIGRNVYATPSPSGNFVFSQLPDHPNNHVFVDGIKVPMNSAYYSIGLDSADHKKTKKAHNKKQSDIAASCFRHVDYEKEDMNEWNEANLDFNEDYKFHMKTDQFVAMYVGRSPEPHDDYKEVAKMAVYFGTVVNCERNKPAFISWMESVGLRAYLYPDPNHTITKGVIEYGMNATTPNINRGVDYLKHHIEYRWRSMWIKEQLDDCRSFTVDTRGQRDIVVSMYFALLRAYRKDVKLMQEREKATIEISLPFRVYK